MEGLEHRYLLSAGLTAVYYNNVNLTGSTVARRDTQINFNWKQGSPSPAISSDTFSARWTGSVQADKSQAYTFHTTSDDGVRLWVGGKLVIDNWTTHRATQNNATVNLQAGHRYEVKLEYFENGGNATMSLMWSAPDRAKSVIPSSFLYTADSSQGLRGEYFDTASLSDLKFVRLDPAVDFDFGMGSPDPRIAADTFSVRWSGQLQPRYSQTYTFYTQTDDGARLYINDLEVINNWTDQSNTEQSGTIRLNAGEKYNIKLEYHEISGSATARLLWSGQSQPKQVIPSSQLYNLTSLAGPNLITTGVSSVKDFGAKGDGLTDDRAAISRAFATMKAAGGGTLLFPPGVYRVGEYLQFADAENINVVGDGATLKSLNSATIQGRTGAVLRITNCRNFTVRGLHFDANARARGIRPSPATVALIDCQDFSFTDCRFSDSVGDHLYLAATDPTDNASGCRNGTIEGCIFETAHRNAISVTHGDHLKFIGNTIRGVRGLAPGCGIDVEATDLEIEGANHDILIADNSFQDCAERGVQISHERGTHRVNIERNTFVNCPIGVQLGGSDHRVIGNIFRDAFRPQSGQGASSIAQILAVQGGGELDIADNSFNSLSNISAIRVKSWQGEVDITNNRISQVAGVGSDGIYGVRVSSAGAVISDNILSSIDGFGIYLSAPSAIVMDNNLSDGTASAIWTEHGGHTIRGNAIIDFGRHIDGECIKTLGGTGQTLIENNIIHNTSGNTSWEAILSNSADIVRTNYQYGMAGKDGAFDGIP